MSYIKIKVEKVATVAAHTLARIKAVRAALRQQYVEKYRRPTQEVGMWWWKAIRLIETDHQVAARLHLDTAIGTIRVEEYQRVDAPLGWGSALYERVHKILRTAETALALGESCDPWIRLSVDDSHQLLWADESFHIETELKDYLPKVEKKG